MTFCSITPDRGDRPQFFEFCIKQLNKLNGGNPMNAYLVNDKPKNSDVDLVPRVRAGIEMAKKDGFKSVYLIESDDFYCKDYFKAMDIGNYDFIGYSETIYYNLKNRTYATFKHPNRSSLFCTAFKIDALENYGWPPNNHVFLDDHLWRWAVQKKKKIKLLKTNPCLGIKHGIGKTAGKGHRMNFRNKDNDLKFLKSRTDEESFEFYTKVMLTL